MATTDGNVQDIAVEDKERPSLAATEEAQDMSKLNKIIVPMPAFTNPNDPRTSGGSINLDLDEHPVPHSEDYGAGVGNMRDKVGTITGDALAEMGAQFAPEGGEPGKVEAAAKLPVIEYPEERADWLKKHWQGKAREYSLPVSGTIDAVKDRVEEYEGEVEVAKSFSATEWIGYVEEAETMDDLDELRGVYDRSGATFSTVVEAFDKQRAALTDES